MKKTSKNTTIKASGDTSSTQPRISPLLLFNISMYTLAAICFMIYTTELNYAHADEEDLGSASSSLGASVTVGTACNFSGNVDTPHTSTIMNGVNSTDIGKTTLNVTCNDQGGYAVYAIGYTNDEYGNTSLKSSISDDYNISTGTSTSGNTSNWSMKLSTVPGTTTATIENSYSNYSVIPDDYTKVATLNTITNPGASTTGSSISTTYQAYISPTQPAGAYTGKVKYTLVHPSTVPAPEKPVTINTLDYMQDFATLSEEDKTSVLNSMTLGRQYRLTDNRDNKKYWLAKQADGNVWMTQNLDLCIGCEGNSTLTSLNTDLNESDSGAYVNGYTKLNGIITWSPDLTTGGSAEGGENYVYTSNSDNNDFIYASLNQCIDGGHSSEECTHYHVGNYYNWTKAIASNSSGDLSTMYSVAANSICPAGWRLPKGRAASTQTSISNEFGQLLYASNITPSLTSQSYTNNGFQNLRAYPLYFVRGGYIAGSLDSRAQYGCYYSSTVNGQYTAYSMFFGNGSVNSTASYNRSDYYSVRCLVK